MPHNPPVTERVKVEQVDRVAAWSFRPLGLGDEGPYKERDRTIWLSGYYDDMAPAIRAFARHRLAARKAGMLEAAGICRKRKNCRDSSLEGSAVMNREALDCANDIERTALEDLG